jgi:hypothetical protein
MKPYLANSKRRVSHKRIVIFLVLIVTLLTAVIFGTKAFVSRNDKAATGDKPSETINYAPATEEEKRQTDQHKEDLAKQQEDEQNQQPSTNKKTVTPIITGAGQYEDKVEVRAYVPSIVESGGKCTFTFKKGSAQFTRTIDTMPGPQSTQCDAVTVPVSEFPSKGTWALTVSYVSTSSSGTSDTQNVEVN